MSRNSSLKVLLWTLAESETKASRRPITPFPVVTMTEDCVFPMEKTYCSSRFFIYLYLRLGRL